MIMRICKSGKGEIRLILFLFILRLLSLPAVSQNVKAIDLHEVQQRKVREYIFLRSFDKLDDFSSIHASWKQNIDEYDFNITEETFYLKEKLPIVWEFYRHTNPIRMWNGRSYRFGLLICKCSKSIVYANNSSFPDIDTGQVYFLNLRLIKGLFNVPVAFEIINIDKEGKIMEFSYIDNNKSLGKQTLEFTEDGNNRTRIVHRSYFRSESRLRDDLFYPYFHHKFIEEFHRNMRHIIKNAKYPDIV
jgi:hypothetical protein